MTSLTPESLDRVLPGKRRDRIIWTLGAIGERIGVEYPTNGGCGGGSITQNEHI